MPIIRKMEEGEVRAVAEIVRDELYDELTVEEVERWIKNSGNEPYLQHYIAEKDREIIGYISWLLFDRYGGPATGEPIIVEIAWLAIKKEYQEQRIGEQLVKESFRLTKDCWMLFTGAKIVTIAIETDEENKKAQRFYERILQPFHKAKIPKVWPDGEGIIYYFAKPDVLE